MPKTSDWIEKENNSSWGILLGNELWYSESELQQAKRDAKKKVIDEFRSFPICDKFHDFAGCRIIEEREFNEIEQRHLPKEDEWKCQ